MSTKTLEAPETYTEDIQCEKIVVYNDDFNSFDHVILSFMEVLHHEETQAHQCAMLIHTKGKYAVKEGTYKVLEPYCTALLERGLSASIED